MSCGTPPFQGIATFARCQHTQALDGVDAAILGIPYDSGTSYRAGARFGPRAIREQSLLLWGYNNALSVAPFDALKVVDWGDVDVVPVDVPATHRAIEQAAGEILASGVRLLSLGGDHSISLPLLRAHAAHYGPLALVHLDAHSDTWDAEWDNQRYSHGTPFRRALEEGLIDSHAFLQIGIRGPTPAASDLADARNLGARLLTMDECLARGPADVLAEVGTAVGNRPTYLSLDIDVVDPAFAPGTGTPEVGGFTSHQALSLVRGLAGLNLVGADLVEVCPVYDPAQITAILAANLAFEIISLWALDRGLPG